MTVETTTRWFPVTETERDMVRRELQAIVSSHHFKNSKRYPALLKYVVDKTLDGHSDQLKERTLGVEVFGRLPDYDTNADPVVRFSAGETRKRIAQFYHENGQGSPLQIDIPLGSYVPEFKLKVPPLGMNGDAAVIDPHDMDGAARLREVPILAGKTGTAALAGPRTQTTFNASVGWLAVLLIAAAAVAALGIYKASAPTLIDQMWKPLLKSPGSVLIVIGNGPHLQQNPSALTEASPTNPVHGPYDHVSFCDAVSLSRLAEVLAKHSKAYETKEADLTSLQDIHDRSVVLIGAYNNLWTMRLVEPLRFHFQKEGTAVRIVDARNPQIRDWLVDYSKPYSSAPYDYAIVARYIDPTTDGSLLVIAGIGAFGTQAASESTSVPHDLEKLLAGAPSGWQNKNLEMVIKTTVINGGAGPPSLVSMTTW